MRRIKTLHISSYLSPKHLDFVKNSRMPRVPRSRVGPGAFTDHAHRTPGEDRLRNSQIQYRPGSLIVRPTGSIVRPGLSGSGGGRPGPCSRRPGEPDALVRARQRLVDDRHNNRAHDNNRDELHGGESIRSARYPGDGGGDVRVQVFVRNRRRQRSGLTRQGEL